MWESLVEQCSTDLLLFSPSYPSSKGMTSVSDEVKFLSKIITIDCWVAYI